MPDVVKATELMCLDEKWLEPFDVIDPFSAFRLEGYLSLKPDYRYGALALLRVNERDVPQRIIATPKLHYPFGRTGEFHFPPVKQIDIYEKLDGTNVLAYQFRDIEENNHVTYKLRLYPILRNGKWGNFLDMWKEIIDRYPIIPELPGLNKCSVSFELYGSRNLHLMVYDVPLDCALLFGVDGNGRCRSPDELVCQGIPVPGLYGQLKAGEDPVGAYRQIRETLQTEIQPQEDEKLKGAEGTVWYVTTSKGERVLFKCKPESVEAIHWKGGISKEAVMATCWNLLETKDLLDYESLERLLLEEYTQEEIDKFRKHIGDCMASVTEQLAFRIRVLDAYEKVGVKLSENKAFVMRTLSTQFSKKEMKKVFTIIMRCGESQG